jgi:hypothetical protein
MSRSDAVRGAERLWILPAVWKTLPRAHPTPVTMGSAFPTPRWTARAPPTGSTSQRPLVTDTALRVGYRVG